MHKTYLNNIRIQPEGRNLINKVLVALDGSKNSINALNLAVNLADKYSAEIQLIAVVPPILLPPHSTYAVTTGTIKTIAKEAEKGFRAVLDEGYKNAKENKPKLKVSTALKKGRPDEEIVETARLGEFDIIIMGSRGLGRRDFALGSISSRVADRAPCPVLIVK